MIFLVRIEARKCHIDQEELDNCAKSITFFSVDRSHFPATNPQLDEYCKEKTASIQCLKRYAQSCLTIDKVQKRYIKKFVSNYRKQLDHTCLRRSERESKSLCVKYLSTLLIFILFYRVSELFQVPFRREPNSQCHPVHWITSEATLVHCTVRFRWHSHCSGLLFTSPASLLLQLAHLR